MFGAHELRQRLNGDGAADNRIGPLRAEPGNVVAPFLPGRSEAVDDLPKTIDRQLVPVQPADWIPPRLTIDLGQIAQRASGANQPIARREASHSSLRQMAPDVVAQTPELLGGGRIGLEEFLAQSKRPERQAHAFRQPAARESGDLQAAAAEIEEQAVRNREPSHRAGETVARFRQPSDNLDSNPQLALQPFSEQRAVGRVAHRGGGHRDDALRSGAGRDRLKIPQRLGRARHRRVAQRPARIDVVDEPQRRARTGEEAQMARCVALEHHHAAGVRPDIDDGDDVAARGGRLSFEACGSGGQRVGFGTAGPVERLSGNRSSPTSVQPSPPRRK